MRDDSGEMNWGSEPRSWTFAIKFSFFNLNYDFVLNINRKLDENLES